MKHTLHLWLTCAALLVGAAAYGQQDSRFSLFNFNQLYFNPASAGSDGLTRFQIINRLQYAGYQTSSGEGGGPNTFMASAVVPLPFVKSVVGLHYINDRIGVSGSQEVQFSYAYKLQFNENTLSIGARAGFNSRFIDYSKLDPREPGDPQIPAGRIGTTVPDLALGMLYNTPDYYVGLAMNHINRPQHQFTTTGGSQLVPNVYLNAGYRWEPVYALEIQPMVLVSSVGPFAQKETFSIEGGTLATYDETYFFGATYRYQDAICLMGGVNLLSNGALRIGGAVDLVTAGSKTSKRPNSFEFMLSYALPAPRLGKKTIVRTPRFRY